MVALIEEVLRAKRRPRQSEEIGSTGKGVKAEEGSIGVALKVSMTKG
jgi:hypothetical protein